MRYQTLAAALLLTTLGSSSLAQSPAEHEAHHPELKEGSVATLPPVPEAPRGSGASQGMMASTMNMMGGNMPMADMMRMMTMMHSRCDAMGGMETIDHVEGRIAYLRTELGIADAHAPTWNAFADALRANAKMLGELRASVISQVASGSQTLVDRLAWQERWLVARLEAIRSMKSGLTNLLGVLSDEQKKAADDLLAPQMCTMPMTAGRP